VSKIYNVEVDRLRKPDISIIVPAFEEGERLGSSVRAIIGYVRDKDLNAELIVVDDGSRDRTAEVARTEAADIEFPSLHVIRYQQNRGKGFAVSTGLRAASADVALFSDADLSTPIEEMPKLVDPILAGEFDVTFGSRALDRSLIGTHQPWRREQGGKVFNLVVRMMTALPFWDTQCGFKAFNLIRFRPLLDVVTIERFGFDVEFLYVANMNGLRLKEIPVRWNNDDRSKVKVLRDSLRMFDEVRQIRRNARTGVYGPLRTEFAAHVTEI
jgi:dolichyl-phosphate beta-glucosyltransferase